MTYQSTIASKGFLSGVGLHTGEIVNLKLMPTKVDTGVIFKRSDIAADNLIEAKYFNVKNTKFCTEIANSHNVSVMTIEHLMAAIWSVGIDNLIVEIDGPEIPAMDGSSRYFISLLRECGLEMQNRERRLLKILEKISIVDEDKSITLEGDDKFSVHFYINFPHSCIGEQRIIYTEAQNFALEIGSARTFGFVKDIEHMKNLGFAKGASLDNAIGLGKKGVVNCEPLRFKDEFVRHKVLDCIGDLYLSSHRIIGKITACKAGHSMNNRLLHEIFARPKSYRWL
tara:strand:- start:298 stop:1146 length:849 start_codon:yes stop_codon:yes gene_type:complete